MSELQTPLFDEEKEFLERKKLEYERALRGDVTHIKDQSVVVGKVALVGAGLAGGVWLLGKLFGGRKRKAKKRKKDADHHADHKSAKESAKVFERYDDWQDEEPDYDSNIKLSDAHKQEPDSDEEPNQAAAFSDEHFEEDPFQDLPYDDSRRLPVSQSFAEQEPASPTKKSRSSMVGSMLQSFMTSETGKVLAGQVAAIALAMVTKKVGEFFPADKNADLATVPGHATAETGASPVATSAPSDSSDASNSSQSL